MWKFSPWNKVTESSKTLTGAERAVVSRKLNAITLTFAILADSFVSLIGRLELRCSQRRPRDAFRGENL